MLYQLWFYDVSYGLEFLRKLKNPPDDGEKPYFQVCFSKKQSN